jgi:hypothetical protein
MADPVKISELPAISSVQANDIIPIVDAALTQTSKATAAQIAAIGGGPPGDGTVTEGKLANGAVTYPKIQNVVGDRVLGRTSGASGVVQEIPCTSFARSLLAAADGNAARGLINDTPTFTGTVTANGNVVVTGTVTAAGQVLTGDGTATAPSYSFSGDTNTGIARLGGADTLSLVTNGTERLRVLADGHIGSQPQTTAVIASSYANSGLLPAFMCRAWVQAESNFMHASANVTSITRQSAGVYFINFIVPMQRGGSPTTAYSVVGSTNSQADLLFRFGSLNANWVQCTTYSFNAGGNFFAGGDFLDAYRWTAAVFM